MTDHADLETRLRLALRERAAATKVTEPRPHEVRSPLAVAPSPTRWPLTVMVAAVAVVALTGAAVVLVRGGDDRTATQPSPSVTWAPGALPRYRLDIPDVRISYASERIYPVEAPLPTYLQVFARPDAAAPRLRIRTVGVSTDPQHGYGIGELTPGLAIQGHPAAQHDGRVGWVLDDGRTVVVEGAGIDPQLVLEIANALTPDGDGWSVPELPDGLQAVATGFVRWGGASGEIQYEADGRSYELSMHTGDAVAFEDLVADRGPDETTSVAGVPAYLSRYADDDWALLWRPSDTTFAEIRMSGVNHDGALAAAAALVPVEEATFLATLPPGALKPDQQATEARRLQADIPLPPGVTWDGFTVGVVMDPYQFKSELSVYASCAWWSEWLAADAAGDADRAAAAIAAMQGSKAWTALTEIADEGGMADFIWSMADTVGDPSFTANFEGNCR